MKDITHKKISYFENSYKEILRENHGEIPEGKAIYFLYRNGKYFCSLKDEAIPSPLKQNEKACNIYFDCIETIKAWRNEVKEELELVEQ